MTVISIQSQVVHGHVGNSAAVFPLQARGIEVAAVPTTLLSNHPLYPTMRGHVLDAELVRDLLIGVEERGLVGTCKVLITGYLGSPEIAAVVIDFVRRAKARNPKLLYLCDPVMGDVGPGFYVNEDLRALFCDALVPLADIITPNQFELEHLVGRAPATVEEMLAMARGLSLSTVVVTGVHFQNASADDVETLAIEPRQLLDGLDAKAFLPPIGNRRSVHGAFCRWAGGRLVNAACTRTCRFRRLHRARGNRTPRHPMRWRLSPLRNACCAPNRALRPPSFRPAPAQD